MIERMFARIIVITAVAVLGWAIFVRPLAAHVPEQHYVVRPYDTLWAIASSHYAGDTRDAVYRIAQANRLGSRPLTPGQTLVLP